MVNLKRWLAHAFMPPWRWRLAFPKATLDNIAQAIQTSEKLHSGELRFAFENTLAPMQVWRGQSGKQRAQQLFAQLGVWDTEENSGVFVYLLLADREVHIIADRGIAKKVNQKQWDAIAQCMQEAFAKGDFKGGSLAGIGQISHLLAEHFPAMPDNPNELGDYPTIIKG
ncbi:TPM domain-containing protein [Methylosoma difficile]